MIILKIKMTVDLRLTLSIFPRGFCSVFTHGLCSVLHCGNVLPNWSREARSFIVWFELTSNLIPRSGMYSCLIDFRFSARILLRFFAWTLLCFALRKVNLHSRTFPIDLSWLPTLFREAECIAVWLTWIYTPGHFRLIWVDFQPYSAKRNV